MSAGQALELSLWGTLTSSEDAGVHLQAQATAQARGSLRHSKVGGKPRPAATSALSPKGNGKSWTTVTLRKETT